MTDQGTTAGSRMTTGAEGRRPFLSEQALGALVGDLLGAGTTVWAPAAREGRVEYRKAGSASDVALNLGLTRTSLKAIFLPPTEPLFAWRREEGDIVLQAPEPPRGATVVFGASPCDAAALTAMDAVMGWDYRDDLWFARREATTVVGLACSSPDRDCFCDAVGLGPEDPTGSDLLLVPAPGGFSVHVVSEKGVALVAAHPSRFTRSVPGENGKTAAVRTPNHRRVDTAAVKQWLASHFDDPAWATIGLRCHGCGACASVCPACHCFDIVDEPDGVLSGTRRRNWDTCQAQMFTRHASGHNPRADQNARFRQRVMHKFHVYPERFGRLLCTGCGRCARACPAGQDLLDVLVGISEGSR